MPHPRASTVRACGSRAPGAASDYLEYGGMRLDLMVRNSVQALLNRVENGHFRLGELREHRPLRVTEEINRIPGPPQGRQGVEWHNRLDSAPDMISYGEHSLAAGPRQCYFWVTPAFWSPYLLVLLLMGTATYGYCYFLASATLGHSALAVDADEIISAASPACSRDSSRSFDSMTVTCRLTVRSLIFISRAIDRLS